jgi:hypothetical protein
MVLGGARFPTCVQILNLLDMKNFIGILLIAILVLAISLFGATLFNCELLSVSELLTLCVVLFLYFLFATLF